MNAYQRLFVWFGSLVALGALSFVVMWLYGLPLLGIEGVYSLEHRRAIASLESLADRERDAFERWFSNQRRELRVLANSDTIRYVLPRGASRALTPEARALLSRKLAFLHNLGAEGYEAIYVTDKRGERLLAASIKGLQNIPRAHIGLLKTSAQAGVSEFVHVLYEDPAPALLIVQHLIAHDASGRPTGQVLGLLVAQVGLLSPLAAESTYALDKELGSRGALLLFDNAGRILANSNKNVDNKQFDYIAAAAGHGVEDVRVLKAAPGNESIAVFRQLHLGINEGVSLVMVSRTEELLAATRLVFWRIAILSGAIFVLAMGLVFLAARQIARGEQAVHDLNASLEQRVIERTEQLGQSNWQLMQAMQDLETTRDDLVRSEKLAALGALVAGIAHEMNTPLGNAVLVVSTLQEGEARFAESMTQGLTRTALDDYMHEHREGMALLGTNLNRAATLVTSFKQLAVDQASEQRREFDVADMVDEVLMVMSPTLRRTPYILTAEVSAGIVMDSYPGPLEQVLFNFINNAILHAFDGRDSGKMHIQVNPQDEEVLIEFWDDGAGMDEEVRSRVFDPFFTTRLGQGGNGLGLHIAYNIVVTLLGGKIDVRSAAGVGSCFSLCLPRMAPLAKPQHA